MIFVDNYRIILWFELISFFLLYTFGLSRGYNSYFETAGFILSIFIVAGMRFNEAGDARMKSLIKIITLCLLASFVLNIDTFGIGSLFTVGRFLIFYYIVTKVVIGSAEHKPMMFLFMAQLLVLPHVDQSSYNANTVGLVYMTLGIFVVLLYQQKKKWEYILIFIFCLYVEYLILQTASRTCAAAFIIFIILRFFPTGFFHKKLLVLVAAIVLTIGSLVYVKTYVYLWENNILIASDIIDMSLENSGKEVFSGREIIWQECLELLDKNPFTGTGSKIRLRSFEVVNIHNSILNIFVIYGYIVGILCIYMLIFTIMRIRPYLYDSFVRNCLFAYMTFLIVGFSETNLMVMPFMSVLPLMLAYSRVRLHHLVTDT